MALKANERYFNSRLFNLRLKHRNHVFSSSPRGCVDCCCFLQRLPRLLGPIEDRWCRSPPIISQILKKDTGWTTNRLLAWGFCIACSLAFCNHAPCKFENKFFKFSWKAPIPMKMRSLSFLSWRLWVEGVGWIVLLGVEPRLDSHETGKISLLLPSAARPHAAIFLTSLLHFARTSVPASRSFTRPLLPSPCPSVRALFFFYPLISLAGHWFGFAIPSLSLGGASVVAEENRYPFYVFIISQIKKLMN